MSTTTERLIRLVERGEVANQSCAAGVLGVSHQRIQQIAAAEGLTFPKSPQKNTLISWPCPGCGTKREMWTKQRQSATAVLCKPCRVASHQVTITCEVCGKERTIPRSESPYKSTLCRPCWLEADRPRMVALGRANHNKFQEHCHRGHLMAEERRKSGGRYYCRRCNSENSLRYYYAKKAK